jgi:hypothetical protein
MPLVVAVNLYLRLPEVVVAIVAHPGLARPKGVYMSPQMQDTGDDIPKTFVSGTRVNRSPSAGVDNGCCEAYTSG